MYKCDICHQMVPPGTKAVRLPVEFRVRHYPARTKANRYIRQHKTWTTDDPGGTGREIVREITACPACAAQFRSTNRQTD